MEQAVCVPPLALASLAPLACGIFVGGASRRMQGFPKALLRSHTGETLLARTLGVVRAAGLTPLLVGSADLTAILRAAEPASGEVPLVLDAASRCGPLGGLVGLLEHAADSRVLAIACDMPHLDARALRALADAAPDAPLVAARRGGRWEPLFARYDAARVLPIARRRLDSGLLALQRLLDEAGAVALPADSCADALLEDVDTIAAATLVGWHRPTPDSPGDLPSVPRTPLDLTDIEAP